MPNNITENTRRFIENSDIDYYTYFIKAWIPFNAWYKNKWSDLNTDREAITKIKDVNNEARSSIIGYLENDSNDARSFRSYLSSLHYQLLENRIENNDVLVSFLSVVLGRNPNRTLQETYRAVNYRLKRERSGRMIIDVTKSNGTAVCGQITQDMHNVDELKDDIEYLKLSTEKRTQLVGFYQLLVPYQTASLLEANPQRNNQGQAENFTEVESFCFIENKEKIAQGLIEIMYSLRCVLFHGELNPNEANNEIYKNSYHILHMILQKLR